MFYATYYDKMQMFNITMPEQFFKNYFIFS